jgi:transposase
MLVAHLAAGCGRHLGASTVRRALQALGFRWRRPRHALPRDPDAAAKLWALATQLWQATAETVILCQDESDVHLLPVLRAMWMRVGQQVRIPTPGGNRKRTVFGALHLESGQWTYALTVRKRAVEFVAFLEQVCLAYPERPLLLIVDNASIHTAKVVQAWLVDHPQVTLGYLPTYSGHQYNPVEKVWWRMKGKVAANRLHGSVEALEDAVHEFFASFTPEDALRLAA